MSVATPANLAKRELVAPRVGILSTFPPTQCGLATFTAALGAGLNAEGASVSIVRVADGSTSSSEQVVGELKSGDPTSALEAAALLNECDLAIVQHEYGLYGGPDGDEVLEVLADLRVPSILIAHTVLREPTAHQRSVLEEAVRLADRVVVMSSAARERLLAGFDVAADAVEMIPHGAATPKARMSGATLMRPMLLTWGLVGPGKGIERVIDAMPSIAGLRTRPRYLVAGRTHPKVLAADGEAYRNSCIARVRRSGLEASVAFDPTYRDVASLTSMIQSATAVVLPYDSREQVTSGVLVDAIAAGRPVVSTAFPHAVEMLASGAGILVEHDDHDAMARALRTVVTDTAKVEAMAAEARRIAPTLGWPVVARSYLDLADTVRAGRAAFA